MTPRTWDHPALVLLTLSAATIGLAAVGAQLAKDTIDELLPALGEPRRAG